MAQSPTREDSAEEFYGDGVCRFFNNAVVLYKSASVIVRERFGSDTPENVKHIHDQMLHSILFLGNIHKPAYKPEHIFCEDETRILSKIKESFPESFHRYRTHVALRTPFSYFLELVTKCCNQNSEFNHETMIEILRQMLLRCKEARGHRPLISRVICICESGAPKCYGASLSCEGDPEREIMTAVSCLHVWHPKVSSTVMSVFPDGTGEPRSIKLPDTVGCSAYEVADMSQVKPPCKRCHQLYSLNRRPEDPGHPNPDKLIPPGNCAETEVISNLLHSDQGVADQTTITGGVYNHQEIEQRMTACFETNIEIIMEGRRRRDNYQINIRFA